MGQPVKLPEQSIRPHGSHHHLSSASVRSDGQQPLILTGTRALCDHTWEGLGFILIVEVQP